MSFLGHRFESVRLEVARGLARTTLFGGFAGFFLFARSSETETGNRITLLVFAGTSMFMILVMAIFSIQEIGRIRRSR